MVLEPNDLERKISTRSKALLLSYSAGGCLTSNVYGRSAGATGSKLSRTSPMAWATSGTVPPWTLRPCRLLQLPVPRAARRRGGRDARLRRPRGRAARALAVWVRRPELALAPPSNPGPSPAGGDGQRCASLRTRHVEPDRCGPTPAVAPRAGATGLPCRAQK